MIELQQQRPNILLVDDRPENLFALDGCPVGASPRIHEAAWGPELVPAFLAGMAAQGELFGV